MMRSVTNGKESGNIGSAMELFCTKDTDWSYQQEWRLILTSHERFTFLNIKAIYLGFKVKKTNENKMKRYSKKYGFELYKMNPPNGEKKIKYTRIK